MTILAILWQIIVSICIIIIVCLLFFLVFKYIKNEINKRNNKKGG